MQALWFTSNSCDARNVVLQAVTEMGWTLELVDQEYQNDKEIVLRAVKGVGGALAFASESLQGDIEVVNCAVCSDGLALEFASSDLKSHPDVALNALQQNANAFAFVSKDLIENRNLMLKACKQNPDLLQLLIESNLKFASEKPFVLEILRTNGTALRFVQDLQGERKIVFEAVRQNGCALEFASEPLRADKEIVLAAVRQDGLALRHATPERQADKTVVLEAVRRCGLALQYASNEMKQNRTIVLEAVQNDGYALQFAAEPLRGDALIVETAAQDGWNAEVLRFASEDLRANDDFMLRCIKAEWRSFDCVKEERRLDPKFLVAAIGASADVLNRLPEWRSSRHLMLDAVEANGAALAYAAEALRQDRGFVLDAVRRNGAALDAAPESFRADAEIGRAAKEALAQRAADGAAAGAAPRPTPYAGCCMTWNLCRAVWLGTAGRGVAARPNPSLCKDCCGPRWKSDAVPSFLSICNGLAVHTSVLFIIFVLSEFSLVPGKKCFLFHLVLGM